MTTNRKEEIHAYAKQFRDGCNIREYGIIDLFADAKFKGYTVIRYPAENYKYIGFCTKQGKDTVIYTNSSQRLAREIFTLAHEIGHALLHKTDHYEFRNQNTLTMEPSITKEEEIKEEEANYFAACLLLPEGELKKFISDKINNLNQHQITAYDVARIMNEFKVSFETAVNRLHSLNIINSSEKNKLISEKTDITVGHLLRITGGEYELNNVSEVMSIPNIFLEMTIHNFNSRAIPIETLRSVLKYYGLTEEDIRDRIKIINDDDSELSMDLLFGDI